METTDNNKQEEKEMGSLNEKNVILATITCQCPKCDKLFDMQRYVEQFTPIYPEDCYVVCIKCRINDNTEIISEHEDYAQCHPWNQ